MGNPNMRMAPCSFFAADLQCLCRYEERNLGVSPLILFVPSPTTIPNLP
jgi:hypothetical protein